MRIFGAHSREVRMGFCANMLLMRMPKLTTFKSKEIRAIPNSRQQPPDVYILWGCGGVKIRVTSYAFVHQHYHYVIAIYDTPFPHNVHI